MSDLKLGAECTDKLTGLRGTLSAVITRLYGEQLYAISAGPGKELTVTADRVELVETIETTEEETTTETPVVPAPPVVDPVTTVIKEVVEDRDHLPTTDTPAVPAPPAATTAVPTDANGLPWDARIHSKTRNQNKDGSWRNIKGVDKTYLAQVEAELNGGAATTATAVPPPPPTTPAAPVTQGDGSVTTEVGGGTYTKPPVVVIAERINDVISSGAATQDVLNAFASSLGVANTALLMARPDLFDQFSTLLDTCQK